MKKYLIITTSMFISLTFLLSNCNKSNDPIPNGVGINSQTNAPSTKNPVFEGNSNSNEIDNITTSFARISSILIKPGESKILQHGHVWGTSSSYLYYDAEFQKNESQTELGEITDKETYPFIYTSYVKNLKEDLQYSIRAYVVTKDGIFYGPISTFQTKRNSQVQ